MSKKVNMTAKEKEVYADKLAGSNLLCSHTRGLWHYLVLQDEHNAWQSLNEIIKHASILRDTIKEPGDRDKWRTSGKYNVQQEA